MLDTSTAWSLPVVLEFSVSAADAGIGIGLLGTLEEAEAAVAMLYINIAAKPVMMQSRRSWQRCSIITLVVNSSRGHFVI